ncbi:MAG: MutS-related protein, partial [Anaerolineales bacterium]
MARLTQRIYVRQRQSNRLSNIRLAVAGLWLGGTLIALLSDWLLLGYGWGLLGGLLFMGSVIWHARVQRSLTRYQIWYRIKQDHLDRLNLNWDALPSPTIPLQAAHPFEIDLDLLDVNRLLDTATSREGSQRLHTWLLNLKPDEQTIQQRQGWVIALAPQIIFRDKLRLVAQVAATGRHRQWSSTVLQAWVAETPQIQQRTIVLMLLSGLALVNIPLFVLFSAGRIPPLFLLTWLPYVLLFLSQSRNLFDEHANLLNALQQFNAILGYIENNQTRLLGTLYTLCEPILRDRPSRLLRRLGWLVGAAGIQRNVIAWGLINAAIPWDIAVAWGLDRQRNRLKERLPRWLDTWHELEALSSLANFAYLHPEYPMAEIEPGAVLQAQAIGHPLIRHERRVTNDFAVTHLGEVIIITGSNMAGKSSFLRTLGVNLSLAYAGSVVAAEHFSVGLFRVFTCIRVTDSLNDGISYFYAEVKRLRALLDALDSDDALPLF